MTHRDIKTIIAAVALGAPMVVSGLAQAGVFNQNHLSPPSRGVAKAACEWVMDDRGNVYCMGAPGEQQRHVSPGR